MLESVFDWFEENTLLTTSLVVASVLVFVGSLVLVPSLIIRIPADYFAHDKRPPSPWSNQNPAIRLTLRILKNAVGVVLLVAGFIMLFIPGQGLLTMFMGFVLLDAPGKYRLEKWLVTRQRLARAINWLRGKYGQAPLIRDDGASIDAENR